MNVQIVKGRPCEVQEVSTRGTTGGYFTLAHGGETTQRIFWNASADDVHTALAVSMTGQAWEGGVSVESRLLDHGPIPLSVARKTEVALDKQKWHKRIVGSLHCVYVFFYLGFV